MSIGNVARPGRASIALERARKTFLGYLQARGKALNTIKNYSCDLTDFAAFCETHALDFQKLGLSQLEAFHADLKRRGLRPNSRRRKIMTAKTFLRYLSGRMDVSTVGSEKFIPPEKVEKPPKLVARALVQGIARDQPDTNLGWRNRALVGVLLETGMLVTEALALRPQDCNFQKAGAVLSIQGKRARTATVGEMTANALRELSKRLARKHFFYGYSRSGPNAEKLTARGVEVLFKGWARALGQKHLHPRTLRHLFVLECLTQGKTEAEIMRALGLRTPYAFRVYRPLISTKTATYSAGTVLPEEPVRP